MAERLIWGILRYRRTHGFEFRRQVPSDEYIVDFHCDEMRVIAELDGDVYEKPQQRVRDGKRERLAELGYTLLRIPNGMAITDPDRLRDVVRPLRPSPGALRHSLAEGEGL